ncbi:glutathione S-transferase-like isoform X2 [Choristoneura fumiferana]
MLLAYSGQDLTETSSEERDKPESPSHRCNLHSVAVLRFLGRSHGLSGADPFEDLEIDKIVDVFVDFLNKIQTLEREQDPELKARNVVAFNEEVALLYLTKLDAVIATNRGHLALSKLTWADFLLAGMWDYIKEVLEIVANNKFHNVELLVQQLASIPTVKLALERISHNET